MDAKVSGEFWSDPAIENLTMEQRLAALWAITSSRTTLAGYVEVSRKRFEFETGCPYDALAGLPDAHAKGFKKCGEGIWIRRFIAHQIGTGDSLVKNRMSSPLVREIRAWHGHELVQHVLKEYPELREKYEALEDSIPELPLNAHAMGQSRAEQRGEEQSREENAQKSQEELTLQVRAKALVRIRPSTPLDSASLTAWKKNKGGVAATTPEDWRALEWFYKLPNGEGEPGQLQRTALPSLLNNWSGEIAKAYAAAKKGGVNFAQEKKKAAEIPDDWKAILTEADPECPAPERFEQLPESVRSWIIELARNRKKEGAADGR